MKTFAIAAVAGALALGACSNQQPTDNQTATADEVPVNVPQEPATTVAVPVDTASPTGDSVTIGKDGVTANVGDSDTRVKANTGSDPSLTVEQH